MIMTMEVYSSASSVVLSSAAVSCVSMPRTSPLSVSTVVSSGATCNGDKFISLFYVKEFDPLRISTNGEWYLWVYE